MVDGGLHKEGDSVRSELVLDALLGLGLIAIVEELIQEGLGQVLGGGLGEAGAALEEAGL